VDYVDVVFCHRPDYQTPFEETCRAMSWVVDNNKAFYWGTSDWPADRIAKAIEICERLNLQKPIVEQPQYNMLIRDQFDREHRRLFSENNYGTTIRSPLAGGILSGKYNDIVAHEGSRYDTRKSNAFIDAFWVKFFREEAKESSLKKLKSLAALAQELGFSQAQLAFAWAIANKDVSTCILGFTKLQQVEENLKALELYYKWTPEIEKKVRDILGNDPEPVQDWRSW
jgi:aryl-alcohol dehydrogenase-like predicted oxidoreductase